MPGRTPDDVNSETREIWDRLAGWWDETVGEGNRFQRVLIGPATERLLALRTGETVLDVACGNGNFSRRLAALGAGVVAIDFSERFLERARERTVEHGDRIDYRLIDATDEAALLTLGERRFDAAVATMALMDMTAIEPLLAALARLLKPGGRFVFSVLHPCFNSSDGTRMAAEQEFRDSALVERYGVRVFTYVTPTTAKGVGIGGQPVAQNYFHRPLGVLFGACFRAGFVLDDLEEPAFPPGLEDADAFSWARRPEIPPVLVARARLTK